MLVRYVMESLEVGTVFLKYVWLQNKHIQVMTSALIKVFKAVYSHIDIRN